MLSQRRSGCLSEKKVAETKKILDNISFAFFEIGHRCWNTVVAKNDFNFRDLKPFLFYREDNFEAVPISNEVFFKVYYNLQSYICNI